ncbi:MAG: DMT family transporter [Bacteroidales bacterium]|nr:DMT family transporter [Bacteroidales bacterium]MCF8389259.1 DMT family transporter [Bacteroidales bacterium]
MNSQITKGYLYAFGASLALAASFVFSKSALNLIDILLFGFAWFGIGALLNTIWLLIIFRKNTFLTFKGQVLLIAVIIAILEGLATVSFYVAIQKMENPAVVSFIGNLGPVLVTIMGITLLGENYKKRQLFGIILALGGVFALTFSPASNIESLVQPGSQFVVFASVLFAAATIIARKYKDKLHPELMSTIRSILLFLVFAIIIWINDKELDYNNSVWKAIIIGSFLETLLTIVFAYQALRYIEAAKTSLIISTKAIWVLVMAYFFLHTFPGPMELIGGCLSIIGIILISLKGNHRSSKTFS